MNVISPFSRPLYVMLKPVGSVCNLACDYCYYLEKGKLYPETKNTVMSEQLLEKFIRVSGGTDNPTGPVHLAWWRDIDASDQLLPESA